MAFSYPTSSGLTVDNMELFLMQTRPHARNPRLACVSKPLPSYTTEFQRHRVKHFGKKRTKDESSRDLSEEEHIYLIDDDSKDFFKEFHNGPCIIERYVDFPSISDYQLDICFEHLQIKHLVSAKSDFYPNLVAMFYGNLRIRRNPLRLYSLVKGSYITLGESELGNILGIPTHGIRIFGESVQSLHWNKDLVLKTLFGVRVNEVSGCKKSFPVKSLTPRAHVLAKIAQFNFLPQGGHYHVITLDCLLLLYAITASIQINLPDFLLHSLIMPREQLAFPCLLTKVFKHFGVNLSNEQPSHGKEGMCSKTINRMFLPRNNFQTIFEGETSVAESSRLKKKGKLPAGKRKKGDEEESASGTSHKSDDEIGILKGKVDILTSNFNSFKKSVLKDLSEMKGNMKKILKKMGVAYTSKNSSSPSFSEDPSWDSGSDDSAPLDLLDKGKRPFTRASSRSPYTP